MTLHDRRRVGGLGVAHHAIQCCRRYALVVRGLGFPQRDWQRLDSRALGVFLNGAEIPTRDPHGEEIWDDSFLCMFNAHYEPITFLLPTRRFGVRWAHELSTFEPEVQPGEREYAARQPVEVESRSLLLLRRS